VVRRVVRHVGPEAGHASVGAGKKRVTVRWPKGAFLSGTLLTIQQVTKAGIWRGTAAVRIIAKRRGKRLRRFGAPIDIAFAHSPAKAKPAFRSGKRWVRIRHLHLNRVHLPAGQERGWYRDKRGRLHVLTLLPGIYGLVAERPAH